MKQGPESLDKVDRARGRKFARMLMQWHRHENKRQMPWKGEKDPYRIWLSEVILQQTRVDQGLKYYESFLKAFPSIQLLAAAPEQKVLKLWEGLGYYSRARNMLAAAKQVESLYGGQFPKHYDDLLLLKGVGPYTAAAISSFAFDQPHAVLDGNVFRVLSRILAIETPSDSTEGKKQFHEIANSLITKEPGQYNQAIMDFGATICKPVPECESCFFRKYCKAYIQEKQLLYPVKLKSILRKERWLNYSIISYQDLYAIKRRETGIWKNLFEFVLLETPARAATQTILDYVQENFGKAKMIVPPLISDQQLTHQTIHFRFQQFVLEDIPLNNSYKWVKRAALGRYPFPKSLRAFIANELL